MFAEDELVRATHAAGWRTMPEDQQPKARLRDNKYAKKAWLAANPDFFES